MVPQDHDLASTISDSLIIFKDMPSLRVCLLELKEEEFKELLKVYAYDYGCEIKLPNGSEAGFRWDTVDVRLIAELSQTLIDHRIRKLQVINGDNSAGALPTGVFDTVDWINEYVIKWYEENTYPNITPSELVKLEKVRKMLSDFWHDGIIRPDGENS